MTTVADFERQYRAGTLRLNSRLDSLKFIGAYISGRLTARNLITTGDLARWCRRKNRQQIYDLLTDVCTNARANTCVVDRSGNARNGVTDQYHVRDVNFKGYTTLRNLIAATRSHSAVFARHISAQAVPDAYVHRDVGTAVCSCVQTRAQCQALARQRDCTWQRNACTPRARSRPRAFRGINRFAGQLQTQGPPPPNARWQRQWRVPENR